MVILIIVIFFVVIGAMAFMIMTALKKSDPKTLDSSSNEQIQTAQEFLPFEEIKDSMVQLGGHRYRAYLECSSINYQLKTEREKDVIEMSFQRFLNSLTFPITFFIQTKRIDTTKMMDAMKNEIMESVVAFPQLEGYGNRYYTEMDHLTDHIGNNKQKKKYLIIPFEEVHELANLTEEEKYDYAAKEIHNRLLMVQDGLSSFGIKAKFMDTKEVAELIYSTYHKDDHAQVENIVSGEYLTLLVESEKNRLEDVDQDAHLDWILYTTQERIQVELLRDDLDPLFAEQLSGSLETIDALRQKVAGYYLQRESGVRSLGDSEDNEFVTPKKMSFN